MVRTEGWWMMASATASGSLAPESARMDLRSLQYQSECWKASSAAATPCTAVPTREVLMKVNMWLRPRLALPMSQPLAPSNSIWQVGEPWQPILFSMREISTLLRSPTTPESSTWAFGTRKSEMPLVPSGAPGSRASTQCTMFSVMSCSPQEMKILVPVMRYEPSSANSAFVVTCPRSEPHCGSVKHIVPVNSPEIIGGSHLSLSSSVAWSRMVLIAPLERPGNMSHV
mmetsp:Transcript_25623/g.55387  ORF Transcript_25623/g.55387 Transcript_25623/m.55387 type:complete len:228 (-) Transcript_25623:444-1127(-)